MIDAKGPKRKIEVPTDTQPQFELGDTAGDIERRRREREEREQEARERQRIERERRDSETVRKGQKREREQTWILM